jgi:hypothetical protein
MITTSCPQNLAYAHPRFTNQTSDRTSSVASTQPGDGSAIRNLVLDPPSWKEKVVGYAKKYRGTMLRRVRVRLCPLVVGDLIYVVSNRGRMRSRNTETRYSKEGPPSMTPTKSQKGPAACNEQ